ncbi:MAG: nucleotidyltransferase family protein [Elusimicrobia bacterium]|nr:nucleotidyltransferase family protein [Elusimicrobiota bacterium]
MKAMILAAGFGLRLRPFTNAAPKALIDINGLPLLEIIIRRLITSGVNEIIINTHHLADHIERFLAQKNNFGVRIERSFEETLLDTGGGLKKASWFFSGHEPFFLYNADILTNLDFSKMAQAHRNNNALATLAVRPRESSRQLLFNTDGMLCGWKSSAPNKREWAGPIAANAQTLAFDGIHVISPEIFNNMPETGAFSMTQVYLRLAKAGRRIQAFRSDEYFWRTIGDPKRLEETRQFAKKYWNDLRF